MKSDGLEITLSGMKAWINHKSGPNNDRLEGALWAPWQPHILVWNSCDWRFTSPVSCDDGTSRDRSAGHRDTAFTTQHKPCQQHQGRGHHHSKLQLYKHSCPVSRWANERRNKRTKKATKRVEGTWTLPTGWQQEAWTRGRQARQRLAVQKETMISLFFLPEGAVWHPASGQLNGGLFGKSGAKHIFTAFANVLWIFSWHRHFPPEQRQRQTLNPHAVFARPNYSTPTETCAIGAKLPDVTSLH